ncbi:MAG: alpha/beta hydrolase [Ruminococcaceae bacterium]|nr:alpha/beta hydrolase [Oscillospiraceae bacterium]
MGADLFTMIWFFLSLIVIILAVLLIAFFTYRICFYSPEDRREDPYSVMDGEQYEAVCDSITACTRLMDKAPCQWVTTRSFDGLTLSARYYHTADGAPLQILFHGYRSMALRDCAGGFYLAKKLGCNILAVDQRAHARSSGHVITFGIKERMDCLSWVQYANERFSSDTPIILSGLSMGASTVLMASALPLPENVVAIMADCPYSSPADIIRKVSRDRHMPDTLAYPFIWLGAKLFGKFSLNETTSVESVRQAKIPILLLHGEDDRFVPCRMSREIYAACASRAELHTFPYAGHGLCYIMDPVRYERISTNFLWSIPALKPFLKDNPFVQKELEIHD